MFFADWKAADGGCFPGEDIPRPLQQGGMMTNSFLQMAHCTLHALHTGAEREKGLCRDGVSSTLHAELVLRGNVTLSSARLEPAPGAKVKGYY